MAMTMTNKWQQSWMLDALHGSGCAASLGGSEPPKPLQGPCGCCEDGSAAHCHWPSLHPHPQPAQASQTFIYMNKSESQGRVSSLPGKFGMVETALSTVSSPDALPRADAPHAATNIPHLHPRQAAPWRTKISWLRLCAFHFSLFEFLFSFFFLFPNWREFRFQESWTCSYFTSATAAGLYLGRDLIMKVRLSSALLLVLGAPSQSPSYFAT